MQFNKKRMAICAIAWPFLSVLPAAAQKHTNDQQVIERNERDNTPSSVFFKASDYKAADAPAVFRQYLPMSANDELRFKTADDASPDVRMTRYEQYYKGIKVEHGAYVVAAKNGLIGYITGNFYKTDAGLVTQPQLDEHGALAKALAYTGADKYIWEDPAADRMLQQELNDPTATYQPHGRLVYVEDYFGGDEPDGHLHLAWCFDIYAVQPLSRNNVYIDAATGRVLFADAIIKHINANGASMYSGPLTFVAGQTGPTTFVLNDSTRGNGVRTYTLNGATAPASGVNVTSTTTTFPLSNAVDAHWGAEKVYDYWSTVRNRLSYDNQNGILNSYVDYSSNYNNAFWSGTAMFYGNGTGRSTGGFDPLVSLDVCGHEIGHGVCQTTAALIYNRESGAMNEGFSDIWGAAIEFYADPHETDATAKRTWDIGEEIANTPLRSMSNPKLYGDPDTYGGVNWKPASSSCTPNNGNDNCGVHSNSGVLNKWFYLLTMGGTGTNDLGRGYAVTGVRMDTSTRIAYGTELSLVNNSNYRNCRTNSINYATLQYGACSKAVEEVTRAWYAVGVDTVGYVACTAQISFNGPSVSVSEGLGANTCPGEHIVNVPLQLSGPAPVGGNAIATITVTGGTAVNGVDYTLTTNTVTFPAGSTTPQYFPITVYDNGNILDTGRYIDLQMTINPNGSNASAATVLMQTRVRIVNDDNVPVAGGPEVRTVTAGNSVSGNATSPFQSSYNQGRIQYILLASDLLNAGIKPNMPLSKVTFSVILKQSTQPYNGFTIKLGLTPLTSLSGGFITSNMAQVFSGNVSTVTGLNTLAFNNNFTWDGTSNLVMEVCFSNTSHIAVNDFVAAAQAGNMRTAYSFNQLTVGGCAASFSSNNVSDAVPVMRFTQEVPPTPIETAQAATRAWVVGAGKQAYFYSDSDTQLIAAINSGVSDLGCVTATVAQAGNGFVPATFAAVSRSIKELTIQPTLNDTATYTATIYVTDTELNGTAPAGLYLLRTTAATDADIRYGNTEFITPVVVNGLNYRGFRGTFTGFGRYFLTDGLPTLAVPSLPSGDGLYVNNNPFRDDIVLSATLKKSETAEVRLYDITGRVLYQEKRVLPGGRNQVTIPVSRVPLVPGNYLLQIIYSGGVHKQKLVKE